MSIEKSSDVTAVVTATALARLRVSAETQNKTFSDARETTIITQSVNNGVMQAILTQSYPCEDR